VRIAKAAIAIHDLTLEDAFDRRHQFLRNRVGCSLVRDASGWCRSRVSAWAGPRPSSPDQKGTGDCACAKEKAKHRIRPTLVHVHKSHHRPPHYQLRQMASFGIIGQPTVSDGRHYEVKASFPGHEPRVMHARNGSKAVKVNRPENGRSGYPPRTSWRGRRGRIWSGSPGPYG
jgi:hypothetical protein